jgi:hypothetical protein
MRNYSISSKILIWAASDYKPVTLYIMDSQDYGHNLGIVLLVKSYPSSNNGDLNG